MGDEGFEAGSASKLPGCLTSGPPVPSPVPGPFTVLSRSPTTASARPLASFSELPNFPLSTSSVYQRPLAGSHISTATRRPTRPLSPPPSPKPKSSLDKQVSFHAVLKAC
ncbi:hypothetical protein BT67DRAFT_47145 [Trichocladium antarcticum]|uniref:Uncharacterized protein n=1 Tax=Trichocladium antarcticum TaxID=1450529 RepID=A0AAN6ZBV1_9PEZI|nr:hypothetical protein BT67DRAFT_47145 [Trichocladium antarcticum]